ncbi:MAG: SUMF1/EgtB/PvdO family nonheme iron enzyme [Elusimicrobia bacterium]|nr:SUMF1/EgtB/PvdO family nonheme iron enzyme [Elusimicrobiota bacterium]
MGARECPFCAEPVQARAIVCKHCQRAIALGTCLECQKRNRAEALFCGHCGSDRLIFPPGGRPAPSAAPAPRASPPPKAPAPAPSRALETIAPDGRERAAGPPAPSPGSAEGPWPEPGTGARRRTVAAIVVLLILLGMGQYLSGPRKSEPEAPPRQAEPPKDAGPGRPRAPDAPPTPMASIPSGQFAMGSPGNEGEPEEHPRILVSLSPFYIDKHEVTVAQFRRYAQETGAPMKGQPAWNEDDHPVVLVDWYDAQSYCRWAGKRLPTEAEWEKAARGGKNTRYGFGDDPDGLADHAWHDTDAEGRTHPAAQKKPNQYGVFDMHGNAAEWVADWYAEDAYKDAGVTGKGGPPSGSQRVVRGGSWPSGASDLRSSSRGRRPPSIKNDDLGFRCALSVAPGY